MDRLSTPSKTIRSPKVLSPIFADPNYSARSRLTRDLSGRGMSSPRVDRGHDRY